MNLAATTLTAVLISSSALCGRICAASDTTEWHPGSTRYIDRQYSEFKPFNTTTLAIGKSNLDIYLSGGELAVSKDTVLKWVRDAAAAVSGYYGQFPVPHVTIVLLVSGREGIGGGMTYGGRTIRVKIGN